MLSSDKYYGNIFLKQPVKTENGQGAISNRVMLVLTKNVVFDKDLRKVSKYSKLSYIYIHTHIYVSTLSITFAGIYKVLYVFKII